jgi:hypothetical protein
MENILGEGRTSGRSGHAGSQIAAPLSQVGIRLETSAVDKKITCASELVWDWACGSGLSVFHEKVGGYNQ